jgi:hypothetical protein
MMLFIVTAAITLLQRSTFAAEFRPPAVPLVTSDPYLSIWSEADRLTDDTTRHWTHHPQSLVSLINIDGKAYRIMGNDPADTPALPQTSLKVLPTRSIYQFANDQVHVTLTFMSPALPTDINVLTWPLTYITWQVKSVDGASHKVSLYYSASSEMAVNSVDEKVDWARKEMGNLTALRVGTAEQPILGMAGDDTRINWGYAYVAAPTDQAVSSIGGNDTLLNAFITDGRITNQIDDRMPRAVNDDQPVMAFDFNLGAVGSATVSRQVITAYDEIYSIKFFGENLRPYWRRNGATPSTLLPEASKDYPALLHRCELFDQELMKDMTTVGGEKYAQICALAYRQCLAGTGIAADSNKQPLLFTKENTSNGDIATVDVIFPMEPVFVFLSPTLAKAALVADLNYAVSGRWKWPCAPHDLGTYPIVRGTDDGGEAMPVEESGNILILCDAIAKEEGNANFASHWWSTLTKWAKFLEQYGLDPEDQLCTDDFMGHLAHNANLSVKAIIALAAYGDMCRMRGDVVNAKKYTDMARKDAQHWIKASDDVNHSRLAFDKPGTWSQKYNLVWDQILGLHVFPPSVAAKEIAFYKTVLQPYGVPLDSRTHLTKTDWSIWSASMATTKADFETLVDPIYSYLNETTARSPLMDSYMTDDIHSDGMHARPVVGGLFIRMLTVPDMWKKWAGKDPPKPVMKVIVPTAVQKPAKWKYTTDQPGDDWYKPSYDDSSWQSGLSLFGNGGPAPAIHTPWTSSDIWIRRTFTMPSGTFHHLIFDVYHDEDVQIYVNGVFAGYEAGYVTAYGPIEIKPDALALLKPGAKITLAAHCHQTTGGQGIDIGLADLITKKK